MNINELTKKLNEIGYSVEVDKRNLYQLRKYGTNCFNETFYNLEQLEEKYFTLIDEQNRWQ